MERKKKMEEGEEEEEEEERWAVNCEQLVAICFTNYTNQRKNSLVEGGLHGARGR